MKEPKRRQSLSGAVLIMILTVMFVLIILLTATLTTVTTANQRIYTKFEENQAYYTARSALDVFTQNLLDDGNYISGNGQYTYGNNATTDMKQGLDLQLDLYTITAQDGMNISQTDLTNYASGITVDDDKKDQYKYYFGTDSSKVKTDASGKEYVEYTVELPALENSGNKYGKLSDSSIATIKVEVLDRTYDMAANSITIGAVTKTVSEWMTTLDETTTPKLSQFKVTYSADIVKAMVEAEDRQKDKMRLKITATSLFDGVEGTAVLIYDTHEPKQVTTSRAVTSLSKLNQGSGFFAVGGASGLYDGTTSVNQSSLTTGSMYIQGSVNAQDLCQYLDGSNLLFVKGDMSWTNTASVPQTWEKGATVFIGGDLTLSSGVVSSFGSSGNEANLIVGGTLNYQESIENRFYGNIYCNTLDLSSDQNKKFGVQSGGKVYTNNLILNASAWQGGSNPTDLNVNLKVPSSTIYVGNSVTCKFNVGGVNYTMDCTTNTVKDDYGNLYSGNVLAVPDGTIPSVSSSNKVNADFSDYTNNPVDTEGQRTFKMPANIIVPNGTASTTDVIIPTVSNLYKEYFDPTAFVATTGEFDFTPSSPTLSDADRLAEFNNFLAGKVVSAETKFGRALNTEAAAVTYTNRAAGETEIDVQFGDNIISSSGILNSGNYGLVAIDARTSNINLQLGDGTSTNFTLEGRFIVYGDKEVTFTMPEHNAAGTVITYNFGDSSGRPCVIADADLVKISETSSVNGATSSIMLSLGNGGTTKPPKINLYAGKNTAINLGTNAFVTGYFYAPHSPFQIAGGANGFKYSYTYSGYTPSSFGGFSPQYPTPFNVIGSVLCQDYTSNQKVGIAYIEPKNDNIPGDPIHDFEVYQYVRN